MARLVTNGFEVQAITTATNQTEGQLFQGSGTVDTSTVRSGLASQKCTNGVQRAEWIGLGVALANTVYARGYLNFSVMPTGATTTLLQFATSGNSLLVSVRITSAKKLRLFNDSGAAQIGSDSTQVLTTGVWYRIELSLMVPASGNGNAEFLLDGVSIVSSVGAVSFGTTAVDRLYCGFCTTPTTGTVNVDDAAVNDSTGAAQNAYPGPGKIVLLKPVSDSARTGWTAGALGTTNLYQGVDNTPPVGLGDVSATNTSQIRDALVNTTDTYLANVGAYSAAVSAGGGGIGANDQLRLVQSLVNFGPVTAAACQVGQSVTSNPVIAENVPAATAATAVSTYPTGWNTQRGTVTYAPAVTIGNQPIVQIRKATSAVVIDADLIGLYVEFAPAQSASLADASLSVDTLTRALPFARSEADASVSSDTLARAALPFVRAATETSASVDSDAKSAEPFVRALSDASASTDAATVQKALIRTATETTASSDAVTRAGAPFTRTTSDASVTGDALAALKALARAATETSTSADAVTRTAIVFARTLSDGSASSDVLGRLSQALRALTETSGTSDSLTPQRGVRRLTADASATSDALVRTALSFMRTASEGSLTADAFTRALGLVRTTAEASVTSDAVTHGPVGGSRSSTDTTGSSDSVTRGALAFARVGGETSTTADALTLVKRYLRATSDTSTSADSVSGQFGRSRSTADESTSGDSLTRGAVSSTRAGSEASVSSDALARMLTQARSSADASASSDSAIGVVQRVRFTADVSALTDSVARAAQAFTRALVESSLTVDVTSRAQTGSRVGNEASVSSDTTARGLVILRTASEASVSVDQGIRAIQFARVTFDTTLTVDAATAGHYNRTGAEASLSFDSLTSFVFTPVTLADSHTGIAGGATGGRGAFANTGRQASGQQGVGAGYRTGQPKGAAP